MGFGDELVAAGQAQRLYDADPSRRVAICDLNGSVRWHALWEGNPIIATPQDVARGEQVHRLTSGPNCRPYITYPFTAETGWTFNRQFRCRDHVSKLYLQPSEVAVGDQARARYGPYVLIEPYSKHQNFTWPLEKWAALIEACPDLTFIQHVHQESRRVPKAVYITAGFREACGLVRTADVYVRSESGLCHAAAAMGVRQVTIFGGCMDPEVMAGYPKQIVIADRGPGSPCGKYNPCDHCRQVMQKLTVETVLSALRQQLGQTEVAA